MSDVPVRALEQSPESFSAQLADEADQDEQLWRDRKDTVPNSSSPNVMSVRKGSPVWDHTPPILGEWNLRAVCRP
jgi:hypothetical protein